MVKRPLWRMANGDNVRYEDRGQNTSRSTATATATAIWLRVFRICIGYGCGAITTGFRADQTRRLGELFLPVRRMHRMCIQRTREAGVPRRVRWSVWRWLDRRNRRGWGTGKGAETRDGDELQVERRYSTRKLMSKWHTNQASTEFDA